ncbi:hypothetical protein J6590_074559, partial [Homalodisca vitripennis]
KGEEHISTVDNTNMAVFGYGMGNEDVTKTLQLINKMDTDLKRRIDLVYLKGAAMSKLNLIAVIKDKRPFEAKGFIIRRLHK